MNTLRFAIDDNLGIPQGFLEGLVKAGKMAGTLEDCELVSFHDLSAMVVAFEQGEVAAMFAPAGTLPYLVAEPEILAEATFGPEHITALRSELVMRASDTPAEVAEVARRKLGRVNAYCTTSYWAPMVSLGEAAPAQWDFYEAASFDDMLFSVVDGRSDAAMVWDAVLARNPEAAAKVRIIAQYSELPTPVILGNAWLMVPMRETLREFAVSFRSPHSEGYFNGFTAPDQVRIERFREGMSRARRKFSV